MSAVPSVTLNNGVEMPLLGLAFFRSQTPKNANAAYTKRSAPVIA